VSIQGLSHIGIAVRDLPAQVAFYRDVLGLELLGEEVVADQRVRVAVFRCGEARIELLAPLDAESPIARFLERRGEGIHHLAYAVSGLAGMLPELRGRGVDLIDQAPRAGAEGRQIAFLHPRSTFGVLTELCE